MFCECKIAACIGPQHRFRDVGKSSRKHGNPLQLKRRMDKRLVKYSKLVHCNGKEPDKEKQFHQSR